MCTAHELQSQLYDSTVMKHIKAGADIITIF